MRGRNKEEWFYSIKCWGVFVTVIDRGAFSNVCVVRTYSSDFAVNYGYRSLLCIRRIGDAEHERGKA